MSEPLETSESLIDLHLGRLSPEEAERLQARIAGLPELEARSRRCRELLNALESCEAPPTPSDLVERVLDRVARSQALIPFPAAGSSSEGGLPSGIERGGLRTPILALRELITIAACVALFLGVLVPGFYKARETSRRSVCRQNMQQVYGGLASYAQTHAGFLPNAGAVPGGSWLRVRIPGVLRASNTRHAYLLVRDGFVNARAFVCPAAGGVVMRADDYRAADDFAEPGNCTYSLQNSNVARPLPLSRLPGQMVYFGDGNPSFNTYGVHYIDPTALENSSAHNVNAGQNVLYLDGRTGWATRPTVGVNNDHIYRAGALARYIGVEVPQSPTDTFLVP